MKLSYYKFKWSVTACLITLVAASCSSQKEKSELPSGDFNVTIRSVKFTDDDNVVTVNTNKTSEGSDKLSATANTTNQRTQASSGIQSTNEFDFSTDLMTNAIVNDQVKSIKASTTGNGKLRAADVPLGGNKKFRLIFMQDGNSTPVYNELLSAGEDPQLKVAANKKYFWYAISINDPNTAPNIDGSGNIAASALTNKDFMFASGEITTKEDANYLDIIFLRQMAAINVTFNTRGIFGGITDNSTFSIGSGTGSSFTNIIQTGTFNIFKGSFSNFQDTDPIKGSEMTIVDSRWGNAEKTALFYSANTSTSIPANNLRVRLNALGINLDDGTVRNFSSNTIVPIANGSALTLTKGTLSKTNVRLIESGINVGGVIWARTNLIYDANKLYGASYTRGSSDAYRFRTNNEYAKPNPNIEFWNFGTATPTGTGYATVDPCSRVYPESTWRLPQELNNPKEMTNLANNTNRTNSIKAVADGYRHSRIWPGSQATNPAYPDNNLILSYYGYRATNGTVQQQPAGNNGTGWLLYQSNEYSANNNNSTLLHGKVSNGTFGANSIETVSYGNGTTIRCVRSFVNN